MSIFTKSLLGLVSLRAEIFTRDVPHPTNSTAAFGNVKFLVDKNIFSSKIHQQFAYIDQRVQATLDSIGEETIRTFWEFQKSELLRHNAYNPEISPTDFCILYCCWTLWEDRSLNTTDRYTRNLFAAEFTELVDRWNWKMSRYRDTWYKFKCTKYNEMQEFIPRSLKPFS
jgi:hypothetical protein